MNKLQPKTNLSFYWYSSKHKRYHCLHPSTSRAFLVQLVLNELYVPFGSINKQQYNRNPIDPLLSICTTSSLPTGMSSQPPHLSVLVLSNDNNLVSTISNSHTHILPTNTTTPTSVDSTALLYDLHSAPFFPKSLLTAVDISEGQRGIIFFVFSDDVSNTPANSPLVTGGPAVNVTRENISINNIDFIHNDTTTDTSIAPNEGDRFVLFPVFKLKDKWSLVHRKVFTNPILSML